MAATRNTPSTDPVETVAAFFAPRLAAGGRRVCVALSGGADSTALLHALHLARATYLPGIELSALHVHHGLSPNADAWAAFCADLCARLGVPLRIVRVRVVAGGEGIEAAARAARYAAFRDVAADWLALAHHRDDQAETLLLNLLRGAGVHGLAAMPAERALAGGPRLARPLLTLPRSAIEAWCAARGIAFVCDESNADCDLRRNFLRHDILPRLAAVFPAPHAALARAAGHAAAAAALADELAVADAADLVDAASSSLAIAGLRALPPARRANLLRHFIAGCGLRQPDTRHLDEVLRQLLAAAPAATPRFALAGEEFELSCGRLWRVPAAARTPPAAVAWAAAEELEIPWAGGTLRCRRVTGGGLSLRAFAGGAAEFRPRAGGESLQPDAARPRRPLKKLLQEAGVPHWRRRALPLLWCGGRLLWAADIGCGCGCDAAFAANAGEAGWLPSWDLPLPSARG